MTREDVTERDDVTEIEKKRLVSKRQVVWRDIIRCFALLPISWLSVVPISFPSTKEKIK